jgi:hypothetical protein
VPDLQPPWNPRSPTRHPLRTSRTSRVAGDALRTAGLLANLLIPGRRSRGLVITRVIGVAGALLGGWLAIKLFLVVTLRS